MFKKIGKDAVDGALARLKEKFEKADYAKINSSLEGLSHNVPIIGTLLVIRGDMKLGYEKMSPEERAEFWRGILIAAAKLAAKM